MDYHSIVFREFTPESLIRIERYRQEEAERLASDRLQRQIIREDDSEQYISMKKSSKYEQYNTKRKPNKELAVGQKLPRILQTKFPAELIGKPIEEIDWYYRTEYVCLIIDNFEKKNKTSIFFSRYLWLLIEIKQYFDLVHLQLVLSFLHLIVFDDWLFEY
jgi:hypothetical protein